MAASSYPKLIVSFSRHSHKVEFIYFIWSGILQWKRVVVKTITEKVITGFILLHHRQSKSFLINVELCNGIIIKEFYYKSN